ncbi:MAG: GNAT family N-acetyltransferase [Eubacteriales bacterium]|nr:GNAT family N-acetyltransferase [Eubacteriales bacterium]
MIKAIKTARLEIRPYAETDQKELAALLTNQEIGKTFMLPNFETEEDALSMAERLIKISFDPAHFERGIYLDNVLIGFVNDVEIQKSTIELGYVIHPAYQNRGYASEMLKAVIAELWKNQYEEVVTGAFTENVASIRVMQKCGMQKMEKEEKLIYRGAEHPCVYYDALARA